MSMMPLCAGFCCLKGCVGRLGRSSILWKGFTEEQPCPSYTRDSPQASLLPFPSVEAGASITTPSDPLTPGPAVQAGDWWGWTQGLGGLLLFCSHRTEP